ncbi:MAG TPA: hypothetical protein VHD81_05180 [Mycobacteriales bacterium]|nr:hypothetical protein [Mycobacteriales bacterium]
MLFFAWDSTNTVGLAHAIAWPVVVLILIATGLWLEAPKRLLVWLRAGGVRSVAAFGVEVTLSEETAEKDTHSFELVLDRYRTLIDERFERLMGRERATALWERVIREGVLPTFVGGVPEGFRCALYVPDPLLGDRVLYQLADYYPTGGGRGRRLSWRFGAVGLAWRLEQDDVWPGVATEASELVKRWGMSYTEADTAGRGRRAIGCVLLRGVGATESGGPIVGLLYMDSTEESAFGESADDPAWKVRAAAIQEKTRELNFVAVLDRVMQDIRVVTPELKISLESGSVHNAIP